MKKLCNMNKVKVSMGLVASQMAMMPMTVYANGSTNTGGTAADALWIKIVDFIGTWLFRGGAVVAVISIVMFFIALANHDPNGRNSSILGIVAGVAIAAIGLSLNYFLG